MTHDVDSLTILTHSPTLKLSTGLLERTNLLMMDSDGKTDAT